MDRVEVSPDEIGLQDNVKLWTATQR